MGGKHMAAGTSFESRVGFMLSLVSVAAIIVTAMVVFPEVDENDPEIKHLLKEMDISDINLIQEGRDASDATQKKRSNKLSPHELTEAYIKSTKAMYSTVGNQINDIVGGTEKSITEKAVKAKPAQQVVTQQPAVQVATEQRVTQQKVAADAPTVASKAPTSVQTTTTTTAAEAADTVAAAKVAVSTAVSQDKAVSPPKRKDAEHAAVAAYEASTSKTTGKALKSIAQVNPNLLVPEDNLYEDDQAEDEAPEEMLLQIDGVVEEEAPAVSAVQDDKGAQDVLSELDNTLKELEGARNSAIWDTPQGGEEELLEVEKTSQKKLKAKLQAKAKKKMAESKHKATKKVAKIKKKKAEQLKKKKERALKKVIGAVKLHHTGKVHLANVIKRGKQRVELRMLRAKRRIYNARTHAIKRMEVSEGGKAAIKAARDVRTYVKDGPVREMASKQDKREALKQKMQHLQTKDVKERLKEAYHMADDKDKYRDRLERVGDDVDVARDRYLRRQAEQQDTWAYGPPGINGINTPLPPPAETVETSPAPTAKGHKAMLKAKFQKMMAALKGHPAEKSSSKPSTPEADVEELNTVEAVSGEPWAKQLLEAERALNDDEPVDSTVDSTTSDSPAELLGVRKANSTHHGHHGFYAANKVQKAMLRSMKRRALRWKNRAHDAGQISKHDVTVAKAAANAAADASDAERGASAVSGWYAIRALDKMKIQSDLLNKTHPYHPKPKGAAAKKVGAAVAKAIVAASKNATKPVAVSVLTEARPASTSAVVDKAITDVACPECGEFAKNLMGMGAIKEKPKTISRTRYEAEVEMEKEQEKLRRNAEAHSEFLQEENDKLRHKIDELTETLKIHHVQVTPDHNGVMPLH
jgi:hypothetical protein